ncbi:hypothetical protein PF003_g30800 [Phytophthora fragariae]|nr:hypothetical protein PF003_g30800 [Phytophthora fragariae]
MKCLIPLHASPFIRRSSGQAARRDTADNRTARRDGQHEETTCSEKQDGEGYDSGSISADGREWCGGQLTADSRRRITTSGAADYG